MTATSTIPDQELRRTPLFDWHVALGAKMVPFAGYAMPVQYPTGILAEHGQCRNAAALFDVSHMGQLRVTGESRVTALESLLPLDIEGLAEGRQRYSFFTNERGGILDDLMVANAGDALLLVVNAACKTDDLIHLRSNLPDGVTVEERTDLALLALQGPQAAAVLSRLDPAAADMAFMESRLLNLDGTLCRVSRSGYTGEDGYEISVPDGQAVALAERLNSEPEVAPVGLGARDSLRLEAGLCLYGHDIDDSTTPIEAGLTWAIQKRRRENGGFPGDEVIQWQLSEGPARRRVGLLPEGRAPVREGAELMEEDRVIGRVTSGGFGPTVGAPVAMGYLDAAFAEQGRTVQAVVRGRRIACRVAPLPFVPLNYHRSK